MLSFSAVALAFTLDPASTISCGGAVAVVSSKPAVSMDSFSAVALAFTSDPAATISCDGAVSGSQPPELSTYSPVALPGYSFLASSASLNFSSVAYFSFFIIFLFIIIIWLVLIGL